MKQCQETIALTNINKTNNKQKFLYQKNILLTLRELLCNVLIQLLTMLVKKNNYKIYVN